MEVSRAAKGMAKAGTPGEPDPDLDIVVAPDGRLTINGKPVVIENGSVEGGCIVGALRGEGVYVPRISIPLDMCRMAPPSARPEMDERADESASRSLSDEA
jgi:hypothetical protein